MSALALDPVFNDLQLVGAALSLVASNSIAETVQELNARFGFNKGEWFMDQNQGFPYFAAVYVKNPDVNALASLFKNMILATPGVASISAFTIALNRVTRLLSWTAQIKHASGNYIAGGYGQPFIVATPAGSVQ